MGRRARAKHDKRYPMRFLQRGLHGARALHQQRAGRFAAAAMSEPPYGLPFGLRNPPRHGKTIRLNMARSKAKLELAIVVPAP